MQPLPRPDRDDDDGTTTEDAEERPRSRSRQPRTVARGIVPPAISVFPQADTDSSVRPKDQADSCNPSSSSANEFKDAIEVLSHKHYPLVQ